MCVCVSWFPAVKGVQVIKHVILIANSCPRWHPFHTLGLSSNTLWDPRGWLLEGHAQGVPTRPCILVIGLRGNSLGAVPQPWFLSPLGSSSQAFRDKRRHVSVLLLNTGQLWPGEATLFVSVRVGVLLKRSCHCTLIRCKAENRKQLPVAYGEIQRPRPSRAEARTRMC